MKCLLCLQTDDVKLYSVREHNCFIKLDFEVIFANIYKPEQLKQILVFCLQNVQSTGLK